MCAASEVQDISLTSNDQDCQLLDGVWHATGTLIIGRAIQV